MLGSVVFAYSLLLSPPVDAKAVLRARYDEFNTAMGKNNSPALMGWLKSNLDPTFVYRSKDGNTYGYKDFVDGLRDQLKSTEKVKKCEMKLGSIVVNGKSAKVTYKSDFEGQVRFDGVPMRLTDVSTTIDLWKETPKGWRLFKSSQTQATTQMYKL